MNLSQNYTRNLHHWNFMSLQHALRISQIMQYLIIQLQKFSTKFKNNMIQCLLVHERFSSSIGQVFHFLISNFRFPDLSFKFFRWWPQEVRCKLVSSPSLCFLVLFTSSTSCWLWWPWATKRRLKTPKR